MINESDQLREEIEVTRGQLSDDVNALAEEARPSTMLRRKAQQLSQVMGGAKDRFMNKVTSTGEPGTSETRSTMATMRDAAAYVPDAIRRGTRAKPMTAGMIAFGVGWLVGSMITAHRINRGGVSRQLAEQMKPLAKQARKQATKQAAKEAKRVVKATKGAKRMVHAMRGELLH